MARNTRGRVPGETENLEQVSLDFSHWRSGRILLLAQGVLIGILGAAAVAWAVAGTGTDAARVPLLGLRLSLLHGAILIGGGALACLMSLNRRAALWFTALAATLAFALTITAAVAASHHARGPLGFDLPVMLLYAVLAAYNIGLLMWLSADAIAGPAWIPRSRSRNS